MHERCARPPDGASRPLRMNSGRTEAIRIQLVNAWQKGLACRIEDALCGATSASSVHEQIEHHHHQRLTVDVLFTALQILPDHVTDAILTSLLSPLGRVAVRVPSHVPGEPLAALATVTAEIGDVARVVLDAASDGWIDPHERVTALREIAEAEERLAHLKAVLA